MTKLKKTHSSLARQEYHGVITSYKLRKIHEDHFSLGRSKGSKLASSIIVVLFLESEDYVTNQLIPIRPGGDHSNHINIKQEEYYY